jgi:hypothetical protein
VLNSWILRERRERNHKSTIFDCEKKNNNKRRKEGLTTRRNTTQARNCVVLVEHALAVELLAPVVAVEVAVEVDWSVIVVVLPLQ